MPVLTLMPGSQEFLGRLRKYPPIFRRRVRLFLSIRHSLHHTATASSSILSYEIPPSSWDSHMHVFGDLKKYPVTPGAAYIPNKHLLGDAMAFEKSMSLQNIVLVQPSVYGNDNSCLLDALRTLGSTRGRGVVSFDSKTISQSTLREWHSIGVRGVRVNLNSVGRTVVEAELAAELHKYADIIRPFNWVLQLWIGLDSMPFLEKLVPKLQVRVCVDHFGGPTIPKSFVEARNPDPYSIPGFRSLINLLSTGNFYMKISAPYRITCDAGSQRDIEPLAKEILRAAGRTSVVFATDWPHTRHDRVDIRPFAKRCLKWCGDDKQMVERLFRGNAEDLWNVQR